MNLTPALHMKNEEYWVGYVLRPLLKVFSNAFLIDTGSTDRTLDIARDMAKQTNACLTIIEEDMGNDFERIGQCSTRLREMVTTDWMLLVDGDEIWNEVGLQALVDYSVPDGKTVCIVNAHNIAYHDGKLMHRDGWSADRLFAAGIRWDKRHDYPFQSYGLSSHLAEGQVHYIEHPDIRFWHMRHVQRSSRDADAFYRVHKAGYFPYDGPYTELPEGWLGEINLNWPNPYLNAVGA